MPENTSHQGLTRIEVPGGWLYSMRWNGIITTTFVPDPASNLYIRGAAVRIIDMIRLHTDTLDTLDRLDARIAHLEVGVAAGRAK